ncbi:MAG TPA: sialate O-acetylesterase [Candidatus Brocadiia bacterium]|nr:sialate O-acetylesterase [Candidatus Brocadiia bacterium]
MRVACLFQDHMVLQREMDVPVWGWAEPGARIEAELKGADAKAGATADAGGQWLLRLPPLEAGGPYELVVRGEGQEVAFRDVLVGEVWVCSGQSNMEFTLIAARDGEAEVAAAQHPSLRMVTVERAQSGAPKTDFKGSWSVCSPATAGRFSAVGYFFARDLVRRLGVPVGMISASWGGTPAEAWVSREGLLTEPVLHDHVRRLDEEGRPDAEAKYAAALAAWQRSLPQDPGNQGWPRGWAGLDADMSAWKTMRLPTHWQAAGYDFSGVFWFRREIQVPAEWAGRDLELSIGACDKGDVTYFNNERVGSLTPEQTPDSWRIERRYTAPGRLVKAGRNVVAVRVCSNVFAGGMTGPAGVMWAAPPGTPESQRIRLEGDWRFRVEHNFGRVTQAMPRRLGAVPATLFNAMIAPLLPAAIRGAIWYQGESNAERPAEYRVLFPTLIRDWRRVWGQGDFPFYFVQLANFGCVQDWPALRAAQRCALDLPNTGMAVTIDIGEARDIHPKNKQDVGARLARVALARTYGVAGVEWSGPEVVWARSEGAAARVQFAHAAGGLRPADERLTGFELAGPGREFHEAEARRVGGGQLLLTAPGVTEARWVRYAWKCDPVCNLRNADGLPASPFEIPLPFGAWGAAKAQ